MIIDTAIKILDKAIKQMKDPKFDKELIINYLEYFLEMLIYEKNEEKLRKAKAENSLPPSIISERYFENRKRYFTAKDKYKAQRQSKGIYTDKEVNND